MVVWIRNIPYVILWFIAAILILIAHGISSRQYDTTLDINIHDTYFVISYTHIFRFLAFWAVICAMGYWVLSRFNIKSFFWLTLSHLVLSIVSIFWLMFELSFVSLQDAPEPYYQNTAFRSGADILVVFFLFPLAQLIYTLNILISIFLRNKNEP